MAKRIFDTNYLIRHWRNFPETTERTTENFRAWAEELIEQHGCRWIVTPVCIEMVAGVMSSEQLKLTHAYLEPFLIVDEGKIPKGDWDEAKRLAQRVPSNGTPRQLADCLFRAIANRLHCDPFTLDKGLPGR
jgi:predicted nucleic acid-binding protein